MNEELKLDQINLVFTLFEKIFCSLEHSSDKFLNDSNDFLAISSNHIFLEFIDINDQIIESGIISGIPGSLYDALTEFSLVLSQLFLNLSSASNASNKVLSGLENESFENNNGKNDKCIINVRKILQDLVDSTTKITNFKQLVKKLVQKNVDLIAKQDAFLKSQAAKTKSGIFEGMKAKKIYLSTLSKRKSDKATQDRVLLTSKQANSQFIKCAQQLNQIFSNIFHIFINKINDLKKINTSLAESLFLSCVSCDDIVAKINYQKDFRCFVKKHQIIRYDIPNTPFESIGITHPAFSEVNTKLYVQISPIYPVGIGQCISNFTAGEVATSKSTIFLNRDGFDGSENSNGFDTFGENEMNCTKGKYYLLMEPIENALKWVLVMNPITREWGYIPCSHIKVVSLVVGVVKEVPEKLLMDGILLSKGEYLAIIEHSGNGTALLCTTTRGKNLEVSMEYVAKICE